MTTADDLAPLLPSHWLWVTKTPSDSPWCAKTRTRVAAGSQACAYLPGRWTTLIAHLRHSHTRLDTNSVENAIRPSKLRAKNWLFIGHPDAGDRAAVIYSLVISCQSHGHDPYAYLRDVLGRLPAMTTADDLAPLLPSHWQPRPSTTS